MQRSYIQENSSRGSQESLFGVRVQVQGIKGQPYVILNSSGKNLRDVSIITHQAGYSPGVVRRSVDERATEEDSPEAQGTTASSFNYQAHPEILRPYDPENNDLSLVLASQTSSGSKPERNTNPVKPRLPLPANSTAEDQNGMPPSDGQMSACSPNCVDTNSFLSVGKLINRFNNSQRRGRGGPKSKLNPSDTRRSRSMDSSQASDSLPSSRAFSLKGTSSETPIYPRGITSAQLVSRDFSRILLEANHGNGTAPPKLLHKTKESCSDQTDGSDERDTQVTPDLLKGQQELSVDSPEDITKQMLFTCLKDGMNDDNSTIQRKVNLLFDQINQLKWKSADKDYIAQSKQLELKQVALEKEVSELKQKLQTEMKNEITLAKACERARTEKKNLQEELAKNQTEFCRLSERLNEMEAELQSTKKELTLMRTEKERSRLEMKDLQQQLSEMHDELEKSKMAEVVNMEKEVLLKDIAHLRADFQEMLQVKEEQEDLHHHLERELNALKRGLKEEVENHDKYVAILKEEYEEEVKNLLGDFEKIKESNTELGQGKIKAEAERGAMKEQLWQLSQDRDQLRLKVQEMTNKVDQLSLAVQEAKATERVLEQRAKQLEREKKQIEETLQNVKRNEEEMCQSNRSLLTRLEDVQSKLTKLNHEQRDLKDRLKEERKQVEELWRTKAELEDERRLQDRTVEQLQRKMNSIMEDCEASTDVLQSQVDEAKEKSQRELSELQRQLQEKGVELEKSRIAARKLQDELLPLEEDLGRCQKEHQEALLRGRQLEKILEELEEKNTTTVEDRERQVKLMEGRISQLEEDLNDERSGGDRLMERLDKAKQQMDQMRSELMQERGVRQDLECDNMSLERQNKDLKSRVSHLEGSQRNNQDSLISKLNGRIQELEERLQGEERDNNNLQQANRKLERKVKEMKIQADEEQINLQMQRDQLTQRLKTAKRQMDEAEEEIERLEHVKKKLQRDVDEQIEANEQLHNQLSTLRNGMRRRKKSPPLIKVMEEDGNDSDDLGSD